MKSLAAAGILIASCGLIEFTDTSDRLHPLSVNEVLPGRYDQSRLSLFIGPRVGGKHFFGQGFRGFGRGQVHEGGNVLSFIPEPPSRRREYVFSFSGIFQDGGESTTRPIILFRFISRFETRSSPTLYRSRPSRGRSFSGAQTLRITFFPADRLRILFRSGFS
jgi:hypothetical protein